MNQAIGSSFSVDQTIVDKFNMDRCSRPARQDNLVDRERFPKELQSSMREAAQRALRCQELVDATTFPAGLTAEERRKLIHTLHTLYLHFIYTSDELGELKELSPTITRAVPGGGYCAAPGGRENPHVFTLFTKDPLPQRTFPVSIMMYDAGEHSYECHDGNSLA
ncbi:MAG: hypothetical protein PHO20_03725 [Candidatus Peribacteraceae bacterium]|nr:hypothetical protein [Candidatus Peribacteraceae bacterium]MDD5739850.1 hypothetical protein [Candidatus Peribacteraceae bacterium]